MLRVQSSEPSTEITWLRTPCKAVSPRTAQGSTHRFYCTQAKRQAGFARLWVLCCTLPGERAHAGTTAAGQLSHIWENPARIFKATCGGSAEYGNFRSKAECLLCSFVCQYLERCHCGCCCKVCLQPFRRQVPSIFPPIWNFLREV